MRHFTPPGRTPSLAAGRRRDNIGLDTYQAPASPSNMIVLPRPAAAPAMDSSRLYGGSNSSSNHYRSHSHNHNHNNNNNHKALSTLSISHLINFDPPSPPPSSQTSPTTETFPVMTTMTMASPVSMGCPSPPHLYEKRSLVREARTTRPSLVERLPAEMQQMVFAQLDYQSLIMLSISSRRLRETINPQAMASIPEKTQFIMRAAKDFQQHRPSEKGQDFKPGNFECYVCFRVREPDHFDSMQAASAWVDHGGRVVRGREPCPSAGDGEVMLRRFCIECGVKTWLHAPFDCLVTKTGRDLWVCLCRRVWAKPGCLRCTDCGADCPLRPRKKM